MLQAAVDQVHGHNFSLPVASIPSLLHTGLCKSTGQAETKVHGPQTLPTPVISQLSLSVSDPA